MIIRFADREAEQVFKGESSRRIPFEIQRSAMRKLWMIDAAVRIDDLRVPPGNRLEKLTRGRRGQYSIRINDQWRICFSFQDGNAYDVEITDYH